MFCFKYFTRDCLAFRIKTHLNCESMLLINFINMLGLKLTPTPSRRPASKNWSPANTVSVSSSRSRNRHPRTTSGVWRFVPVTSVREIIINSTISLMINRRFEFKMNFQFWETFVWKFHVILSSFNRIIRFRAGSRCARLLQGGCHRPLSQRRTFLIHEILMILCSKPRKSQ